MKNKNILCSSLHAETRRIPCREFNVAHETNLKAESNWAKEWAVEPSDQLPEVPPTPPKKPFFNFNKYHAEKGSEKSDSGQHISCLFLSFFEVICSTVRPYGRTLQERHMPIKYATLKQSLSLRYYLRSKIAKLSVSI